MPALDRETVDQLCWRVLGRTDGVTEQVLALNPGLSGFGTVLPAGIMVTLPDAPALAPVTRDLVKLWD